MNASIAAHVRRRLAARGQSGMVLMAGLVIWVGLCGVSMVALMNMTMSSSRIATIQAEQSQRQRAVDSALETAVNSLRFVDHETVGLRASGGGCVGGLERDGSAEIIYDDALDTSVSVTGRCDTSDGEPGPRTVGLRAAVLLADGDRRPSGTASVFVTPIADGPNLVDVSDWSLMPDGPVEPPPTTTTSTTTTSTTTTSSTTTTTRPPDVVWDSRVTSDWWWGYCMAVEVENPTQTPIEWRIQLRIDGIIYTSWSGEFSASTGTASVRGLPWNRVLPPGGSTSLGFCAIR